MTTSRKGRLWRMIDPSDFSFARCGRLGTWAYVDGADGICPECTASRMERIPPLLLEWLDGSDVVGDFSWPGASDETTVTDRATEVLSGFTGFRCEAIEFREDPRAKNRVLRMRLPYRGPPLHDLWITAEVAIDPARSTATREAVCSTCGHEEWSLTGAEHTERRYDAEDRKLTIDTVPRVPGQGIFVAEDALDGNDIFRIRQFPAFICCTDRVRDTITANALTNIGFREMGEIV